MGMISRQGRNGRKEGLGSVIGHREETSLLAIDFRSRQIYRN